jgi:phosphoribosyl 1,2-cyclic phosphodiesterase
MTPTMQLHLCGVRGSTPSPGPSFVRYGGQTSCVAVVPDGAAQPTLLLDAGTGIRQVTELMGGRPFMGTILLTHLHWDHVHGLPFFAAGDRVGAKVRLCLPEPESGDDAVEVLSRSMSPPHFPITPEGLLGDWRFECIGAGPLTAEGFVVDALDVCHKGGRTFAFRVRDDHSTLVYLPDHGPRAIGPGPEGWGEYPSDLVELCRGADVLLHDAMFVEEELERATDYGHAIAEYAVGLGERAGVKTVLLAHHAPSRTDDQLDAFGRRFARSNPTVEMAVEGAVLRL